ncbi:hypothetical protein BaOVIS_011530 [Babesia ovis]|uniref:Inhibitor of growth protein N-terminal histone-binding domain-containing protein n=1 Tax=Babesia ovis TaxID=5869 RepID=A0A9W5T945_BABOV|nr:hypothetical protein BaOVIS_011530 [Babesia ovis]
MDSTDDITDDLLTLPGFIRRNLLLMRELDLKFVSLLESATKQETQLLSTFGDSPSDAASSPEVKNEPGTASISRQGSDADKGTSGASKGRGKSKQTNDSKSKSVPNESKRQCRGGVASPNSASDKTSASDGGIAAPPPAPRLDPAVQKEIDTVQNTRMDALYLMQEKLAINDQVTCMLKREYDNLKVAFDNVYREMEATGQMTDKLRMSFTINKTKPLPNIDSLLTSTERELFGIPDGTGSGMTPSETNTPTAAMNAFSNLASALTKTDGIDSWDSSKT